MKSQNLLSPIEINWLKDHNLVLPNKSETRKRIKEKVGSCLTTLDFILSNSYNLDQEYWDSLFPADAITRILGNLIYYDGTRPPSDDKNKLAIAGKSIKLGFEHYQSRFKKTKFFYNEIMKINDLLTALNEVVSNEEYEAQESKLYAMRKKWLLPPDIMTSGLDDQWRALCMICWNWSTGKNKSDAIAKINHHPYCKYDKRADPERYFKVLPPRNQI